VVIIIGILAAIAIPVFLSQRERAWNAAAASELRNMAAAATACSADNNGDYNGPPGDCGDPAILDNFGWTNDEDITQTETATDTDCSGTAFHPSDPTCVYTFTTDETNARAGQVTPDPAC
jgi:type IV pilus assembly protein PilA